MYFYLDTNVILDYIEQRRNDSIYFFEKIVRTEGWSCCTSYFTILELIDQEQQLRHLGNLLTKRRPLDEIIRMKQKKLNQDERSEAIAKVDTFFEKYMDNLDIFSLNDDSWDFTIKIMDQLDISAPDALHLTVAIEANVDIFVSNDSDFIKVAKSKIPSSTVQNIDDIVKEVKKSKKPPEKQIDKKELDKLVGAIENGRTPKSLVLLNSRNTGELINSAISLPNTKYKLGLANINSKEGTATFAIIEDNAINAYESRKGIIKGQYIKNTLPQFPLYLFKILEVSPKNEFIRISLDPRTKK